MDRLYRSLETSLIALSFCLVLAAAALPSMPGPLVAGQTAITLDEISVSASAAE